MPQDENFKAFKAKYKGTSREQRNKAIRAEMAGGNQTLDLLELVHKVRTRQSIDNPRDFLELVEDRLHEIREAMVEEVERRYQIGRHQPK